MCIYIILYIYIYISTWGGEGDLLALVMLEPKFASLFRTAQRKAGLALDLVREDNKEPGGVKPMLKVWAYLSRIAPQTAEQPFVDPRQSFPRQSHQACPCEEHFSFSSGIPQARTSTKQFDRGPSWFAPSEKKVRCFALAFVFRP